jgi:mediator of RNA polymerase II transcription subunit 14
MAPIEMQQQQQQMNQQQLAVPNQGSISLSMLIDFIVQRTYHDLTVLAEL